MRRVFALCNAIGLDKPERLELAEMLLGRDVTSYKQLVHYDAVRLVDAMVGFGLVSALKDLREPCRRCGQREASNARGECRACQKAWDAWTAPPEAAEVISDAIVAHFAAEATAPEIAAQIGEAMRDVADALAPKILEALHTKNYRVDHH